MKFEFIKKIDGEVMSYGNIVKTGSIVDLPEHLSLKAMKRPLDYRLIEEDMPNITDTAETPTRIKRKYTRKANHGDESGNP